MPVPTFPKRVRFSRTNTEYTIPANPSPTYSSSSLPDSDGPITPPSYLVPLPGQSYHHRSYAPPPPPKPKPAMQPIRAHPLLKYSDSHQPSLNFDVTLGLSALTARYRPLPTPVLSEPAVSPPVSSLLLKTDLLPWTIPVYASSNGYFVTVRDVLDGIHMGLRRNVSHDEWNSIPSRKDQLRVKEAYERRYSRIPDYQLLREEKQGGVRRVDYLCRRTRFMGVVPSKRSGVWEIFDDALTIENFYGYSPLFQEVHTVADRGVCEEVEESAINIQALRYRHLNFE
ncbi:hypothetical protein L218DRAFT_948111 [Marasmius fiardii PR-910]|nr:hypothetical protein L218DRAFT_949320 [Marasmius fiardii PR-910]KAF9258828.1 hypothetical protein L218DRAFT_948111 [Marasmius fiardii PR-910]